MWVTNTPHGTGFYHKSVLHFPQPHDSTGLSPSMMLYERELDTPLNLITQPSCDGMDDPGVSYPETLKATLEDAHHHARAALDLSHKRQKHFYNMRHHNSTFAVVILFELSLTQGLMLWLILQLNWPPCSKAPSVSVRKSVMSTTD